MKLLIEHCRNCQQSISLNVTAHNRGHLRSTLQGDYFKLQCNNCHHQYIYNISEVKAKEDSDSTTTGAIVGGLVGLLGGPLGVLIGAGFGGMIGNGSDTEEKTKVRNFNESW